MCEIAAVGEPDCYRIVLLRKIPVRRNAVGAGALANAVGQWPIGWLTLRIRQRAGSYSRSGCSEQCGLTWAMRKALATESTQTHLA